MKQTAIEKCALELSNQGYQDLQNNYQHLKDVKINDHDKKLELTVRVMLGVSDYTRVKMQERPRVGLRGEPMAELIKLRSVILSFGKESASTNILFTRTSLYDYKNLYSCRLHSLTKNLIQSDKFGEYSKSE